ncbi:hypothetical protein TNCV_47051 [Trichonephila clavipes]|nr:hypothetical protein TNCV_47051 [Trichonephila clavipes]
MVWGAIGYTSRSPLVRIDDTLNSARYISGVLLPVALLFICVSPEKPYFSAGRIMHDHILPVLYVPSLVRKMFGCALVCTFTKSLTNSKRLITELLVHYHTPVTIVNELRHRVEAARASVPVHAMQSLFDSISMRMCCYYCHK